MRDLSLVASNKPESYLNHFSTLQLFLDLPDFHGGVDELWKPDLSRVAATQGLLQAWSSSRMRPRW